MDEQAKQDEHAGQGGSYELVNGVRVLRSRTAERAEPVPPLSAGAGGEQSEPLAKTRRRSVALGG